MEMQNEMINRLESMLFNAVIAWYDDSLTEYHGLDDRKFVERVCSLTGMTEEEYQRIIL